MLPVDCEAVRVHTREIPDGDAGIYATVAVMQDICRTGLSHPLVRWASEQAVQGVPHREAAAEVDAVSQWIVDRVDFRSDPIASEWLQAPWTLIACKIQRGERPQVDCDDLVLLSCSMLGAIGYDVALCVIATQPDGVLDHVYGLVKVVGVWQGLDLAYAWEPDATPGPEYRTERFPVSEAA